MCLGALAFGEGLRLLCLQDIRELADLLAGAAGSRAAGRSMILATDGGRPAKAWQVRGLAADEVVGLTFVEHRTGGRLGRPPFRRCREHRSGRLLQMCGWLTLPPH